MRIFYSGLIHIAVKEERAIQPQLYPSNPSSPFWIQDHFNKVHMNPKTKTQFGEVTKKYKVQSTTFQYLIVNY